MMMRTHSLTHTTNTCSNNNHKIKTKTKYFQFKLGLMRSSYDNYPPPAAQSIQPEGM